MIAPLPARGAVLIVKNEAAKIKRCLASAVAAGVTVATIVDTGSTDSTVEAIESFTGLDIRLHHRPFVDFGTTRSEAFALARGTADWLLALDADMTVEWDAGFEPDPDVAAYMLRMGTPEFEYRLPLLLRGDLPWESRGVLHEYTVLADGSLGRREPSDAVRVHYSDGSSPAKTAWHIELLEASDLSDPRNVFYLAQEYKDASRLDEARREYQLRAEMGGWDEEAFYARYMAATLELDPPTRLAALLDAWETRPQRLEPLHDALQLLNRSDAHRTAYALSGAVLAPCSDVLFVHRWIYDYGVKFERSIAAWYVDRPEFERLTAELLAADLPAQIREAVERNAGLLAA